MDVVDAQIHMGPGGIDEVLAAMNALGITGALVDEYWLTSFDNRPHYALPDGAQRPVGPTAELAALMHPDRFAFLLRIGRLDPDYEAVIRHVRDAPGGRALRIDPGLSPAEVGQFADGGYDHIFRAAADAGLPLFVFGPDSPDAFARAARAFPDLRIAADHCGLYSNSMRTGFAQREPLDEQGQLALFDRILALSEFPNVALKWGHASSMFDLPAWPGDALSPILCKAVSAFGAERVLWASDYSVNQRGESWADLLYGVRGDPGLSEADKAKVLGGSLRAWIGWPA